jgi:hypothetical protein
MNKESSRLWLALPTAIIVGICNVFAFFLFMVLYGHVIDPGHEEQFYQDAASRFGPYASIIAGIPIMYIAGRILRRYLGSRAIKIGIAAWCIYLAVDVAIVTAMGQILNFLPHVVVSFATKFAAIYFGARIKGESE